MGTGAEEAAGWMPFLSESDPLPQQVSPFATTSAPAMAAAFAALPNQALRAGFDVLLDLGCGDGRIVIDAAQRFGVRAFGVDLSTDLLASARQAARDAGVDSRVVFEQVSFLDDDFRFELPWASSLAAGEWNGPTVITSYLTPKALRLLEPKVVAYVRRAKEQANIDVYMVTLVYGFNNWTPIAENEALKVSVYNFQTDELRSKQKNNKDTDGYLPAF